MERSLEGEQQQQLDIPELDLRAIPECALVKRPDAGFSPPWEREQHGLDRPVISPTMLVRRTGTLRSGLSW